MVEVERREVSSVKSYVQRLPLLSAAMISSGLVDLLLIRWVMRALAGTLAIG